jgi:predicted HAD superfamily Cof-like phosphohydrolase
MSRNTDFVGLVTEFMVATDSVIGHDEDQSNLYASLIEEEFTEFSVARIDEENARSVIDLMTRKLTDPDSKVRLNNYLKEFFKETDKEKLDACCDMIWVIIGYCISNGWDIIGAMNEVHRSNMSKVDPVTGKCIRRESDNKIMKPESYTPPDLSKFI